MNKKKINKKKDNEVRESREIKIIMTIRIFLTILIASLGICIIMYAVDFPSAKPISEAITLVIMILLVVYTKLKAKYNITFKNWK